MTLEQKFVDITVKFIDLVAKVLPDDVVSALSNLKDKETEPMAKAIYESMFENMEKAVSMNRPICQDTGVLQFFLKVGTKFPLIDKLSDMLIEATTVATNTVPLRHNAVETFIEKNTGTNTGKNVPYIEYELVPNSDKLEMIVYMAGGGCVLPGRSMVMMPSAGYEGIADFVADTMVNWGINACPPLVVGVGIGTCVASAAKLAKKASLRPLGTKNDNAQAHIMEQQLEKALNGIGLGPQGIPGKAGCVLGVNVENMARHPSAMGAAVSFGCWAHRRGTIVFDAKLNYEILDHKNTVL